MKKNYVIIGAGLLLLYWYLKNQKAKKPTEQLTTDKSLAANVTAQTENLLISPSLQQDINEYTPEMKTKGSVISVKYVAGVHYI